MRLCENEDRISELHEALLVHIMSSLPTKTVVATSVLSKRWRHVWKTVQNLKFVSKYHQTFSEDVYRFFMLHKAPFLESLDLEFSNQLDASDLGILVGIAFARHVRSLVLDLDYYSNFSQLCAARFPSGLCIYDNSKTLETLTLKHSILLYFPSRVCLKSLRKLHLYKVHFYDEDSVCNLLCGCPSLRDLVVHRKRGCMVTFTIVVPSLQRLTIKDSGFGYGCCYVINAPSLKYLNIRRFKYLNSCLIEKAPELEEAKVSDVIGIKNESILESLTSAKRLSLHLSPLEWWNLLTLMLEASPKLQILKLTDLNMSSTKGNQIGQKWIQLKCVPECLLFHLETFVWTGYEWQRRDEKEVARYILRNTTSLKKATFSTKPIEPVKLKVFKKRREILNELASLGRASNPSDFVFESI
ncbi:F-box domain [Arabidopsis suecica]|uniref:F-box domain n=1 Tax=Arabidopsis suecica TaxID=45249 RepID=A0A8T2FBV1_ARASU|nr:F-box domain [Arabidopsis suecica]